MESFLKQFVLDEAKDAHYCRANLNHRISRGERRLTLRKGGVHYCIPCALKIIQENIAELERLQRLLREPQTGVIRL